MQPPPNSESGVQLPIQLGLSSLAGVDLPDYTPDHYDDTPSGSHVEDPPAYKSFAFAMRPAPDNQIHIRFGVLVNQINRLEIDENGVQYQAGISNPIVTIPDNFKGEEGNRYSYATLDWVGDVYLYWETDCNGKVTLCDIRGPSAPETSGGSESAPDSVSLPSADGGKFSIKLGSCGSYDIPALKQDISSDVYWISAFEGECSSSSSSSSSDSDSGGGGAGDSSSTGPPDSGSDKSTAIVPMVWHDKGYGALFTMESNEVLFEFVVRDIDIKGRKTVARIDDRYIQVCDRGTMTVAGAPCGDRAGSVGAVVKDGNLILSASPIPFLRPKTVTLKLTGVRKGFSHLDMPERSKEQFVANEKFINSAYPSK